MAKKPTKKELKQTAEDLINLHLASKTPEQIKVDTLLAALPGGAGGEAFIYACHSLKANPGMRMNELQLDACCEASLNYSTAGWIVGTYWGDNEHFGALDLLWERRKEKLSSDKRPVWHYYLLPAGETLASVDPRENTYRTNIARIESGSHAGPGNLLIGSWEAYGYSTAISGGTKYKQVYRGRSPGEEEAAFIAVTYLGMVRGWDTRGERTWVMVEASGPDDPSWATVMRSRQVFLGCIGPDGEGLAIPYCETKAIKT
jgi:hypothetical protein